MRYSIKNLCKRSSTREKLVGGVKPCHSFFLAYYLFVFSWDKSQRHLIRKPHCAADGVWKGIRIREHEECLLGVQLWVLRLLFLTSEEVGNELNHQSVCRSPKRLKGTLPVPNDVECMSLLNDPYQKGTLIDDTPLV